MKVSIVVPTWLRAQSLKRCLHAIARQTRQAEDVVIVGRADDHAAREVVHLWRASASYRVRWTEVGVPGHVAPIRQGIQEAAGDVIAFLDDDTEPEERWLSELLKPFAVPRVACVGGSVMAAGVLAKVRRDAGKVRWY